MNFDAHRVASESRKQVEDLLRRNRDSFEDKNAKRASVAAAPLAAVSTKLRHRASKTGPWR